jgi:CheY-like chemotaxis protein
MSVGSAASLHAAPGMSLSQFRSIRVGLDQPMAKGASPLGPVQALAASEPPRGRVLLVGSQPVIALDLQRQLREAGYRTVGPATTVADIRALMARGRIDAAVLDLEGLEASAAAIADLLVEMGVPFVFLASGRELVPAGHTHRPILDKPYSPSALRSALDKAIADNEPGIVYPVAPPISWPRVMPQL